MFIHDDNFVSDIVMLLINKGPLKSQTACMSVLRSHNGCMQFPAHRMF